MSCNLTAEALPKKKTKRYFKINTISFHWSIYTKNLTNTKIDEIHLRQSTYSWFSSFLNEIR